MDKQMFFKKYGKIKILDEINQRHPVHLDLQSNDPNRNYMIKFKYGNLSIIQQYKFHQNIKKLIYKVMHSNNVMMDWDDVYQQIWKKIIKCRHTWNESKGTRVSTWITVVANSVINTLRQNVNKYNSRYCLYDDIYSAVEDEDGTSSDRQKFDMLQYGQDEQTMMDDDFVKKLWMQKYNDFIVSLDEGQKVFMNAVLEMQDDFINAYDKKLKIPHNALKKKLGYDDAMYNTVLYNVRKKYCIAFQKRFDEFNYEKNNSKTQFLF